jgi:hypothetical protein
MDKEIPLLTNETPLFLNFPISWEACISYPPIPHHLKEGLRSRLISTDGSRGF